MMDDVSKIKERLIREPPTERLGAHSQEHHVAVDKLLFVPSREEVMFLKGLRPNQWSTHF